MNFKIRNATAADAETIAAYNSHMSAETEGAPLDIETVVGGVSELLANAEHGRYWVAESDGVIVGQVMVTYEWSDWRNGRLWWIQSVYVHPDYRRQGVFSALYRHVEALARAEHDVRGIRLYVENDNVRAQHTYFALGMIDPNYKVMQTIFEEATC